MDADRIVGVAKIIRPDLWEEASIARDFEDAAKGDMAATTAAELWATERENACALARSILAFLEQGA